MPDYVILTDSSADLSAEMVREAGVTVLPLSFTIQGETYENTPDNREMDPALFYDMLRAGELATTSAVNVAAYTDTVEPLLQAGKDVLILAFSSGLSTTCNSAEVAAEELRERYPQRKLYVVDTLCASLGQGLLVWLAAREQKKGRTIEEVRDWAETHKQAVCHQFTVQDLKFFKAGRADHGHHSCAGLYAPDQAAAPCGPGGQADRRGKGPGPSRLPEDPGGPDGKDGDG